MPPCPLPTQWILLPAAFLRPQRRGRSAPGQDISFGLARSNNRNYLYLCFGSEEGVANIAHLLVGALFFIHAFNIDICIILKWNTTGYQKHQRYPQHISRSQHAPCGCAAGLEDIRTEALKTGKLQLLKARRSSRAVVLNYYHIHRAGCSKSQFQISCFKSYSGILDTAMNEKDQIKLTILGPIITNKNRFSMIKCAREITRNSPTYFIIW